MFDRYGFQYPVFVIIIFQLIAIGWIYGMHKFSRDFAMVNGFHPHWLLKFLWKFFALFAVSVALIGKGRNERYQSFFQSSPSVYSSSLFSPSMNLDLVYPPWAVSFCAILMASVLIWAPFGKCAR